jgi:hypothetical protein
MSATISASCLSKTRHATKRDAKRAIAIMYRRQNDAAGHRRLQAYACGLCGGWHIGHDKRRC